MIRFFRVFLFCLSSIAYSQGVSGIVVDEDQTPLPAVLVFNLRTEIKSYSNINGEFTIEADSKDELRFVRAGFERSVKIVNTQDFGNSFTIRLVRVASEIEEVTVTNLNLSGDLNKDSRKLQKFDKVAQLQRDIGVPLPPEKPREVAADFKRDVLVSLLTLSVKPQAIYDLISGDARRKKAEYRYEDLQDNINWVRSRVPDDYFTKMKIPEEKISEFLQFSIGVQPDISKAIRARNLSKVLFYVEETLPKYLNRSK